MKVGGIKNPPGKAIDPRVECSVNEPRTEASKPE
jgi:hypothetical protein